MTWTNLSFAFGSVLTSTKMTQLFDDITALANGDSGAPSIVEAALASAVQAQLVTSGDAHDHSSGYGGKINPFTGLSPLPGACLIKSMTLPSSWRTVVLSGFFSSSYDTLIAHINNVGMSSGYSAIGVHLQLGNGTSVISNASNPYNRTCLQLPSANPTSASNAYGILLAAVPNSAVGAEPFYHEITFKRHSTAASFHLMKYSQEYRSAGNVFQNNGFAYLQAGSSQALNNAQLFANPAFGSPAYLSNGTVRVYGLLTNSQ